MIKLRFLFIILIIMYLSIYTIGATEKDNSKVSFTLLGQIYQMVKDNFYGTFDRVKFLNGGLDGTASLIKEKGKNTDKIPTLKGTGDEKKDVSNFEDKLTEVISIYSKQGIKGKDIMRAALDGMLDSLKDPYTVYMDPTHCKQFNEAMGSSDYSGIGIFIELDVKKNNKLIIVDPIEGCPASKAGLRAGDEILEINGIKTQGMDAEKASKLIKGPEGSIVVIKITREKASHPIEFEINRAKIHVSSVTGKIIEGNIGLIKIKVFGETTGNEFTEVIKNLESQGAKGIIIDLRNNGGGYVTAAVSICSHFINKGEKIVIIKEKKKESSEVSEGLEKITLPVVILVNKYSASASEITSGALQDYGVAKLVGDNTFGKGCIQSILDIKDAGALKITIANYYTPKGRAIHHIGLQPDIKIQMDEHLAGREKNDIQLKKAIELLK